MNNIRDEITKLCKDINRYNNAYYNEETSLVSDKEYDELLERLKYLERKYPEYKLNNSPTSKVGDTARSSFKKVKHKYPMLSLDNSYNIEDIKKFISYTREFKDNMNIIVEAKLDGLSLSVIYKDGKLYRALTRGNGIEGEDVTENAKMISNIPLEIPYKDETIEFRGEVMLSYNNFHKINEYQKEHNEKVYSNPRNLASGTLRQLDPNVVRRRNLEAFFYYVKVYEDPDKFEYHSSELRFIEKCKCPSITDIFMRKEDNTSSSKVISLIQWMEVKKLNEVRAIYPTDGLVLKVDDLKIAEKMGYTTRSPRHSIAYKFKTHKYTTSIRNVIFGMGKSGRIVPVAEFNPPVEIDGVIVKRATLNNFHEIKRLDVKINSFVEIERAAEVIPKVLRVIKNDDDITTDIKMPEICSYCGEKVHIQDDEPYCINQTCPGTHKTLISHFVSKNGMDIQGISDGLIDKLMSNYLLRNWIDLFSLHKHRETMINMEGLGEKTVDNILKNIEDAKYKPLHMWLRSMGIPNLGKTLAKTLCKRYKTIDDLFNAEVSELIEIKDVGAITAAGIVEWFMFYIDTIDQLKALGVTFNNDDMSNMLEHNVFNNKTFCITGSLNEFKNREELVTIIETFGGIVVSSVSSKLDYLIVGENAGSKLDKARRLNCKIISEQEFKDMIVV